MRDVFSGIDVAWVRDFGLVALGVVIGAFGTLILPRSPTAKPDPEPELDEEVAP